MAIARKTLRLQSRSFGFFAKIAMSGETVFRDVNSLSEHGFVAFFF